MATGQSNKARRAVLIAKFGQLYKRYPTNHTRCVYCGSMMGVTRDHVPPLDSLDVLGTQYFEDRGINCWIVAACGQCNSALGATDWLHTLTDRRSYIADFIRRKYKRALGGAIWSQDELDALGRGLREYVERRSDEHSVAMRRLLWATGF